MKGTQPTNTTKRKKIMAYKAILTHAERRARENNVMRNLFNLVDIRNCTVKIDERIYHLMADVAFNTQAYFIQRVKKHVEKSGKYKFKSVKKMGSFICPADQELDIPLTQKQLDALRPKRTYTRKSDTETPKPVDLRKVTMHGLFGTKPIDFVGMPVEIEVDVETWTMARKVPKFIDRAYKDTIELYRRQEEGSPAEYLQVTDTKKYLYRAVQ